MAPLSRKRLSSVDRATNHDRATNPGAKRHQKEVVKTSRGTGDAFSIGRDVGIVIDHDGALEFCLQQRANREVGAVDVRTPGEDTFRPANEARDADPDGFDILGPHAPDGGQCRFEGRFAGSCGVPLLDNDSILKTDGQGFGPSDVDPDGAHQRAGYQEREP
jgi:hypothetical protein